MKDKISIIIPVYNVSKYLPECMDSVLSQTYKNLEIILVNDGSTDESGKSCDSYSQKDKRIKVIHKKRGGPSDARNAGLSAATGKYIGFVDSDDYIEPDMYETLLKILSIYDADIAGCPFYHIKRGKIINQKYFTGTVAQFNTISALEELIMQRSFSNNVWNKIYKKKLIQDIEFPVNVYRGEDMIFNYKAFVGAKKSVYVDTPKYYYFYRQDSIMHSHVYVKEVDDLYQFIERLEFISINFPSLFNLTQKKLIEFFIILYRNLKYYQSHHKKNNLFKIYIKNYIRSNYKSLVKNPLISRKNKLLLKIFNINFELLFLFIYNYKGFRRYYRFHIKPYLPPVVQKTISTLIGWLEYLRVQKVSIQVIGPRYHRSRKFIEIDITYACNLKCYNCDRSCNQAPSHDRMKVAQIRQFLDESIAGNIHWERIRIMGGEPTLRPDLLEIIDMIRNWRSAYAPGALIELSTNGYGHRVKEILKLIPDDIIISNSNKDSQEQLFDTFNIAPSDTIAYKFADFRNGCWITKISGIGLTPYGYYPCAPAGAIDRVFGFGIARDRLPAEDDDLYDQFKKLCPLCGHFERRFHPEVNYPIMSKTWKNAYELYSIKQPILSRYGEKAKDRRPVSLIMPDH